MIVLLPLGIFALVSAVIVLVAWLLGEWYVAFLGIPFAAVIGELIWRNWWGDRWLRERLGGRDAKQT